MSTRRTTTSCCSTTKEPFAGSRPHSAWAADEEGPRRNHDPRLQAERRDNPARRSHGEGDGAIPLWAKSDRLGSIGARAAHGRLQSVGAGTWRQSLSTSLFCARAGKSVLGGNAFPLNWTAAGPVTPFCRASPRNAPSSRRHRAGAADKTRMGRGARRNDRAASIRRDDKHCRAAPARSCRRGSFTRRARRQRPVLFCPEARTKRAVRWRPGTIGGAFTRWRIGGGARGAIDGKGRQGNRDMRSARRPAARATAREAADGLANVGQASRWGGEASEKAGASRGSGRPFSASVSGRPGEWAALRLGRLVLLLVCISGLCRGLTPLGSAASTRPSAR
jgi:hypothetical protein